MNFFEVLQSHMENGAMGSFYRESEPHTQYDFEAAEGPRFWSMNHETDDLEEHAFTAEQIFATDWVIKP